MKLNHNMYSLEIYKNYKTVLAQNSQAIANLSSGKKLNSAKDNPNKIADSDRLKISILSRKAAENNMQDTNSMVQTFDGALQEIHNNVSRLKELAVKAATGTNSDQDSEIIQNEMDTITKSIDDLANNTEFNGVKLAQANGTTKKATVGSLDDETIDIPFFDVTSGGLDSTSKGLGLGNLKVSGSDKDTDQAITDIDAAVKTVSAVRSKYGAIQRTLEDSQNNGDEIDNTLSSAQSSLEDADIATEAMNNSSTQIIIKASISLMAQSNKLPQDVLNILSSI